MTNTCATQQSWGYPQEYMWRRQYKNSFQFNLAYLRISSCFNSCFCIFRLASVRHSILVILSYITCNLYNQSTTKHICDARCPAWLQRCSMYSVVLPHAGYEKRIKEQVISILAENSAPWIAFSLAERENKHVQHRNKLIRDTDRIRDYLIINNVPWLIGRYHNFKECVTPRSWK